MDSKKKDFPKIIFFIMKKFKMEKSNFLFYADFKNLHVLKKKKEFQTQLLPKIRNKKKKK